MRYRRRIVASLVTVALVAAALVVAASNEEVGSQETGGNFIATGHDMELHCAFGETLECDYFKIVVDKVRNSSTLPILALDPGTQVSDSLVASGYSAEDVETVDPTVLEALNATTFTNEGNEPLYSAIIVASHESCGGCNNTDVGVANINDRAADFATFFNHGGGILALSGAGNPDYYNFVPLSGLTAVAVAGPFAVTEQGAALGITDEMANCCATHNSFSPPASPLITLETDGENSETIAAFGAAIDPCEDTTTTIEGECGFVTTSTSEPDGPTTSSTTSTTSSTTTTTTPSTGFVVTATFLPDDVNQPDPSRLGATVQNVGTSTATGTHVVFDIDEGSFDLAATRAINPGSVTCMLSSAPGENVDCAVGNIPAGSTVAVNAVVTTDGIATPAGIVGTVTATSANGSTGTATDTLLVKPDDPNSTQAFVPPGESAAIGPAPNQLNNDNPVRGQVNIPRTGPGAPVKLSLDPPSSAPTACGGQPCNGLILNITAPDDACSTPPCEPFAGYTNRKRPVFVDIDWFQPTYGRSSTIYKIVNGVGVEIPRCHRRGGEYNTPCLKVHTTRGNSRTGRRIHDQIALVFGDPGIARRR